MTGGCTGFKIALLWPEAKLNATPDVQRHITVGSWLCFEESNSMLWTIFVILLVLWLLGWVGFHVLGAYIHILLVLALIVLFIQLFSGRRPVV